MEVKHHVTVVRDRLSPNGAGETIPLLFRSFRTCMSIDARPSNDAKVLKDLNLYSGAPFIIKVLTDLENRRDTFFYRH